MRREPALTSRHAFFDEAGKGGSGWRQSSLSKQGYFHFLKFRPIEQHG